MSETIAYTIKSYQFAWHLDWYLRDDRRDIDPPKYIAPVNLPTSDSEPENLFALPTVICDLNSDPDW